MFHWLQAQRSAVAVLVAGVAVILAWLLNEPNLLIVSVLAGTLAFGWRLGLALVLSVTLLLALAYEALALDGAEVGGIVGASVATWLVTTVMASINQAHMAPHQTLPDTAERRDETALREVADAVPALIWSTSTTGRVTHVNKALIEWLGIPVRELGRLMSDLPRGVKKVVHPADSDMVAAAFERAFRTGSGFALKYRQRFRDGEYRWVDGRFGAQKGRQGQIEGWYGVDLDIDVEMRAFEQLRQSELELRRILDTVPAQIWLLGPDGGLFYINKQCADWLGIDHNAVFQLEASQRQRLFEDLYHPDDLQPAAAAFMNAFETVQPFRLKFRLRRRDGQFRWLDNRVAPLRDEAGGIVRWYGISFDIDEEVNAIEALRNSKQHLQRVIDTVPVMLFRTTASGEPVYANERFRDRHGYELDDFGRVGDDRRGSIVRAVVHKDDKAEVEQAMQHSFTTGVPFRKRYRKARIDGSYGWIEGRIEPLRDSDGTVIEWYGVNLDVDDEIQAQENLRLAQEQLSRAAQGASLAELSASIANEVNQPLAAIVADAKACEQWLSHEVPNVIKAREAAIETIMHAETASEIVNRIRSLFKSSARIPAPANVNEVVLEVIHLMKNEIEHCKSKIDLNLAGAMRPISIDRVQIQQVLVNLVRNGLEAMAGNPLEQRLLTISTIELERQVSIEIVDRGVGIADTKVIFEPLFTTKDQGIGMGLSISRSVVERHGGQLSVTSIPGKTAFTLILPA